MAEATCIKHYFNQTSWRMRNSCTSIILGSLIVFFLSFPLTASDKLKNSVSASSTATVDLTLLENKVKTLRLHRLWYGNPGTPFTYSVQVITSEEYQAGKPSDALPFDCGYTGSDNKIYVSEPVTPEQLAVFNDINQAALYYLCGLYISYYYNYSPMPVWFKNGIAAFESHLGISDDAVKNSLNSYGGSVSSFDILNDRNSFVANNGLALSYLFGEFMSVYQCWQYYDILRTTETSIEIAPWYFECETMEKFLGRWNRYLYNRILEPDENLRIKLNLETVHFKFYFRNAEAFNFPAFSDTLETAYIEYVGRLNVQPLEKLTFFTIPECKAAEINGVACGNRLTSGTAWSSGLNTSCAYELSQLPLFSGQNRHELAHTMQGNLPQGSATSWVNEGFACFYEGRGPLDQNQLGIMRQELSNALKKAEEYFGHRPTYEDAHVYPNPDYGYYSLGTYFIDYIYRRGGGDQAVKNVCINDTQGFMSMGYDTPDAFLKSFYYDFDVRINQKSMADLTYPSPAIPVDENNVTLKWIPLDPDVKLNVSVSLNDTSHWTPIATDVTQSEQTWNAPENFSGRFYIKFSHTAYKLETILGPFLKNNVNSLNLVYPEGNEMLFADDTVSIRWANTHISKIRIDFSSDDGATWSEVKSDVETSSNSFDWHTPFIISSSCRLKIADMGGTISSQCSNTFRIVEANTPGGPYKTDKNTVVLLHFDNNLKNESALSADGTCFSSEINYSPGLSEELGSCIKPELPVKITHCSNLNLSGDWTIETWAKLVSFPTDFYQAIVTKPGDSNAYESNFSLLITPFWDNVFHYIYFAGTNNRIGVTARKPDLNEWYHVMCTRDTRNSKIKIVVRDKNMSIVDAQEQSFTGNDMYLNSQDLIIGENFYGYLDELRISNIVRNFDKPAAPQLISPQNNAPGVAANPDVALGWTNGSGTQRVDLYVGKTNTPEIRVLDNVAAVNTYTLSSPEQGAKYFWKVVCRNANGSTEGPVWSFTTATKTGIGDNYENKKGLSVYPNPAKDVIYIIVPQSESEFVDLKIFNTLGVTVHSEKVSSGSRAEVNLEHFPKGTYLVQIKDDKSSISGKFVRE